MCVESKINANEVFPYQCDSVKRNNDFDLTTEQFEQFNLTMMS